MRFKEIFDDYLIVTEKLSDNAPEEAIRAFEKWKIMQKEDSYGHEDLKLIDVYGKYLLRTQKLRDDAPEEAVKAFEEYTKRNKEAEKEEWYSRLKSNDSKLTKEERGQIIKLGEEIKKKRHFIENDPKYATASSRHQLIIEIWIDLFANEDYDAVLNKLHFDI